MRAGGAGACPMAADGGPEPAGAAVPGPGGGAAHAPARWRRHHLRRLGRGLQRESGDRKSTRLNSSHVAISYAVFCLKKKKDRARSFITAATGSQVATGR